MFIKAPTILGSGEILFLEGNSKTLLLVNDKWVGRAGRVNVSVHAQGHPAKIYQDSHQYFEISFAFI